MPKRRFRHHKPPTEISAPTPPATSTFHVQDPALVPAAHGHRPDQQAIEVTQPDTAHAAASRSSGMAADIRPSRPGPPPA